MNLQEVKTEIELLNNQIDAIYDHNYLLKKCYDQILASYIVNVIGIHSVVKDDGVKFFKGGQEICSLCFKTDLEENIIEDSFYLHCYSSNAVIGTDEIERLIIIGKIATDLPNIVKGYLQTVERNKVQYIGLRKDTTELRDKLKSLKKLEIDLTPISKTKKTK